MSNILFAQPVELYPAHLVGTVAVSATNVNADWPAANLIDYNPYKVFKTTTTGTAITFDLGNSREFDTFSLLHTNITYEGTWVIETSPDNATWTTRLASAPFWCQLSVIPGAWSGEDNDPRRGAFEYSHSFYKHATVITHRYIRITVANTTNPAGILSFGRLFVGKSWQPDVNYSYGSDIEIIDKSERVDMPRSAPLFNKLNKSIKLNISMEFSSQEEMENYLYEFSYWSGITEGMLVCLDPETVTNRHKALVYGTLNEGMRFSHTSYRIFEQKFSIQSLY